MYSWLIIMVRSDNMNTRLKMLAGAVIALIIIFLISFFVSDMIINKDIDEPDNNQSTMSGDPSKVTPLNEKMKIALFKGDIKEKEQTLGELSKDLGLEGDITKETLSKALDKKGYVIEGETPSLLTFKRTIEKSVEPNKYYIKAEGDYLAIFKSDDKGELKIEDKTKDIYKNSRKYSDLPAGDKHVIDNLELKFETKEEAMEEITSFIS